MPEKKISFVKRFGLSKEANELVDSLSMLLSSGVDIVSALDSIEEETNSGRMKEVISFIKNEVASGSHLWLALKKAGIFPERIISLIKIGEGSGKLIENMEAITVQQEKEWVFRSRVRSAMLYPIFVFCFVIIIATVNAWYVLPRLANVFSSIDVKLPLITRIVIGVGNFLGHYGFIVIPAFFLVVASFIYFFFSFPRTRYLGQILLFTFPGIKKLIQQVELARFGYIMGSLIKSGVPVTDAINSMYEATTARAYQKFYLYLESSIEEGNSFQKSFHQYPGINKVVPISVQQMIFASEKSGNLANTLTAIGKRYETKTETFAKDLASIIEPILLVILGLAVAVIAISVILPIYSLVSSFNQ